MAAAETRRAIAAANAALPSWRALPAKERSTIVHCLCELMMAHEEDRHMALPPMFQ